MNHCYLEPNFPKEAFIVSVFIMQDGPKGLVTLTKLYTDPQEACLAVEMAVKAADVKDCDIPHDSVLLILKFEKLIPLKKSYWRKPTVHYDNWDRNQSFLKMGVHPELYKMLVTPTFIDHKEQLLEAVLPLKSADERVIENFMMSTDQVVDQRAKSAAIYAVEKRMRFNWKTGEIRPPISEGKYN